MSFQPQLIFVDEDIADHPRTQRILERCPHSEVRVSPTRQLADPPTQNLSLTQGKKTLWLTTHKGAWFKKCPGTAGQVCCNYYIMHQGGGCHYDCAYCFLQGYQNNPMLQYFVNLEDGMAEIEAVLTRMAPGMLRLGTGEYTDSLNLDHLTDFSLELMPLTERHRNVWLEFKTKSASVENLLKVKPNGRVVVGFSLTPSEISRQVDHKTAPIEQRLEAACRVARVGYRLALHLDPLIRYPGWEQGYEQLLNDVVASLPLDQIAWVSMGTLRFAPEVKKIAMQRLPNTRIYTEEFVRDSDGKQRYLRPLRVAMFKHVQALLREKMPHVLTYLCMETPDVWQDVFGFRPSCGHSMGSLFDGRLVAKPDAHEPMLVQAVR